MLLLVLENKYLDSIDTKFKDVPNSSKLDANPKTFNAVMQKLRSRPILTSKWLVYISPMLRREQRKTLVQSGEHIFILRTHNKGSFTTIKSELSEDGFEFKTFDMASPPKPQIVLYIMDSLNVDESLAKYIANRQNYYFPRVVESVNILKGFDSITKTVVQRYVEKSDVYISDIVDALLHAPKSSPPRAARCIYKFQYATKYLLESILKELRLYFYVYDLIRAGYLSLENFKSYCKEDSTLKSVSLYKLEKLINSYSYISYDFLCYRLLQVEEIKPRRAEIYKLLQLIWR